MTAFADLFIFMRNGMAVKQSSGAGGLPISRIETISDGTVDPSRVGYAGLDLQSASKWVLQPGDLLFSHINSPPHVGKVALYTGTPSKLVHGMNLLCLRPNPNVADAQWALHLVRSAKFRSSIQSFVNRAVNQASISIRNLGGVEVQLPPLAEQRRIAAILDQADGVRNKRVQVIAQLDELAPSIFLDMFGQYPGPFKTVEEVAERRKGSIRTGPFGSQLLHSEFVDQGIAVLGLDNVVGNTFGWGERRYITAEKYQVLKRYTVHPGDVMVSIMGTCGRCVVVPVDVGTAINTKHVCAITVDPEQAAPEFVRAAFLWHPQSRNHLSQRTKGSIMNGLNMGIVKEMPLPLPALELQERFVNRLREAEEQRIACAKSLNTLDSLFESLQGRAFGGQL